jgi:hypothetical protein
MARQRHAAAALGRPRGAVPVFRRFSDDVATSQDHRSPRSGLVIQTRRGGQGQLLN